MAEAGNAARFAAAPMATGGTPARTWLDHPPPIPELDLRECPGLLLVAPHPDDETLGFGATAAGLSAAGVEVSIVLVTDGEAAYPPDPGQGAAELAKTRRAEARIAAERLGAADPTFLGLPDGRVAAHEAALTDLLTELLDSQRYWCAATWRGDGHPDHEAVGRAAAAAAGRRAARLLEYLVWTWHWAQPGHPAVPWHRMAASRPGDAATRRKWHAMAAHDSQLRAPRPGVEPIITPATLDRLRAVGEAAVLT